MGAIEHPKDEANQDDKRENAELRKVLCPSPQLRRAGGSEESCHDEAPSLQFWMRTIS